MTGGRWGTFRRMKILFAPVGIVAGLIAALAIEGAIFRVTKGVVDHQMRSGFAGATGRWPGKDPAKEDA